MFSLGGMICIYILALIAGKHSRTLKIGAYLLLLLLAVAQTGIIMIDMFNRQIPTP